MGEKKKGKEEGEESLWTLLILTSHLGDSGIKHRPTSNEMQGTSPKNFKFSQQLEFYISIIACKFYVNIQNQIV